MLPSFHCSICVAPAISHQQIYDPPERSSTGSTFGIPNSEEGMKEGVGEGKKGVNSRKGRAEAYVVVRPSVTNY